MTRISIASLVLTMLLIVGNVSAQIGFDNENRQQTAMSNLSAMPLAFTENRGQWDEKALYRAEAGGAIFFFCADEVVYVFTRDTDELFDDGMPARPDNPGMPDKFDRPRYKKESMVIKAQFVGANPDAEVVGEDRLGYDCNYFLGNDPANWRTDVPNYSAITYRDIWLGIDLRYHGNGQGMKYDFIVNPGADISQIRVRYDGANDLAITPNGDLLADTRFGLIYENIPSVYQEAGGSKNNISGQCRIIEPGVFGFEVEGYNPSLVLVIDPELLYSTYLGGSGDDYGYGIAVDGSGSAYVTGWTWSSDFPTVNPYDGSHNGSGYDVFVTKLSASGGSLVYSTYLGGIYQDEGLGIAVDGSGSAYVIGYTSSSDFPTVNPYDGSFNGSYDVFVTKLSASGGSLVYSTYLGGIYQDEGHGIAVDGSGSAYVTGYTQSSDFPTVNPYDGSWNGFHDVFVSKLSDVGSSLVYSTYLGGSDWDVGWGIAVNGSGSAYVTGFTSSSNFPTVDPYDESFNVVGDVFATKFSASGSSLLYSTYLGGSDLEAGYGIAVDGSGSAYVTGFTYSSDFPTVDPYDATYNGGADVFVTRLSAPGSSLVYSTYLGGSSNDAGFGIALHGSGSAYVTGGTESSNFPTVDPYDGSYNGGGDVFVTRLSDVGSTLLHSTYLGGSSYDDAFGIAVEGSGPAYVTGLTGSDDFPTVDPYQASFYGFVDVFVAKFGSEGQQQVPTLSEWGMLIMGMILLATGTIAVIKRKRVAFSKAM